MREQNDRQSSQRSGVQIPHSFLTLWITFNLVSTRSQKFSDVNPSSCSHCIRDVSSAEVPWQQEIRTTMATLASFSPRERQDQNWFTQGIERASLLHTEKAVGKTAKGKGQRTEAT